MNHRSNWGPKFRGVLLCFVFVLSGCHEVDVQPEKVIAYSISNIKLDNRLTEEIEIPADQYVVIRVEGQGTEVIASIQDDTINNSYSVTLAYFRLHPLFLTAQPAARHRKLQLHLDPIRTTKSGSIDVQIKFFRTETDGQKTQLEAYTLLTSALTTTKVSIEERAGMLEKAGVLLTEIGQLENVLWADFFRAYLTYWYPFDLPTALAITEGVVNDSEKHSFQRLHIASLQLLGAILIERKKEDTPEVAKQRSLQGQKVLERVQGLAKEQDMPYEVAWALNNSGIGYYYQKDFDKALTGYDAALQITRSLGDAKVSQLISGNRVFITETFGRYYEAIETLENLSEFMTEVNELSLLASNHRELGRLYRIIADYPLAVNHLVEAQSIYHQLGDSAGEGRTLLSLGIAHMQMGRYQIARAQLEIGLERINESGSGVELRDAIRVLADIERQAGNSDRAKKLRLRQAKYLDSSIDKANYQYGLAMDMVAEGNHLAAYQHFENCALSEGAEQDSGLKNICNLHLAHLKTLFEQGGMDISEVRLIAKQLMNSPSVTRALSSQQLLAEIEFNSGNERESLKIASGLVDKMLFYRASIPGVMGAWYWESRKNILEFYFDRLMESNAGNDNYAELNLLAFMKLQNLSVHNQAAKESVSADSTYTEDSRNIRELIAKRTNAKDPGEQMLMQNQLDSMLLEATRQTSASNLNSSALQRHVRTVSDDVAIITYYFGKQGVIAWVLSSSGIEQITLHDESLVSKLKLAKDNFRVVGSEKRLLTLLDELGEGLLARLPIDLPRNLYFLTSGPLTGFPPDALRLNGKFLSDEYNVSQVLGVRQLGLPELQGVVQGDTLKILLAGGPDVSGQNFTQLPAAIKEIQNISDTFPSSNVTLLKGRDLTVDSLMSAISESPDIVHIASHATLNLEYPELSKISLSMRSGVANPLGEDSDYLSPVDIGLVNMQGSTIVLSACETAGSQQFSFDSNLGFVSEFINAGADSVIATLWPVGDEFSANFMSDFYTRLGTGNTLGEALAATKRAQIRKGEPGNNLQWAAFQLYRN